MTDTAAVKKLFEKYRLTEPVEPGVRGRILRSKASVLKRVLGRHGVKGPAAVFSLKLINILRPMGVRLSFTNTIRSVKAGAAAAAAIVPISALYLLQPLIFSPDISIPGGVITASAGRASVITGDAERSAEFTGKVNNGDRIVVPEEGGLLLQFPGPTVINISGGSEIILGADGKGRKISLVKGELFCNVMPGPGKNLFTVTAADSDVRVTGTRFTVSHNNGAATVMVIEGTVSVKHLISGAEYSVAAGMASQVNPAADIRPLTSAETARLSSMGGFAFIDNPESLNEDQRRKHQEQFLKIIEDTSKKADSPLTMSFDDIKNKYGRIDEIIQYNGKTTRGAIISRGDYYRIITPSGLVSINSKEIKDTKTIK
jgi:hypothetical protein